MFRTIFAIFLVVLILGLSGCGGGTDTSDSNGTTPPASKSWHSTTTFSGTADQTTAVFNIPGGKFRLTWTATPTSSSIEYEVGGSFYIFVYPEGETALYVGSMMAATIMATTTDTSYVYEGGRSYYLKVTQANLESWEVKVESYH